MCSAPADRLRDCDGFGLAVYFFLTLQVAAFSRNRCPSMRRKQRPPLESVHNALRLVLALQEGQILGVKEAAAMLGVVPSTAHRLLSALCYDEFAQQDGNRRYRSGQALALRLGDGLSTGGLRRLIRPALATLNTALNETVQLWMLQGSRVRQVDSIRSSKFTGAHTEMYEAFPAYCSAAGKALLAGLDTSDLDAIHAEGLPGWGSSRIKTLEDLRRHLAAVRQNGYALNIEEALPGINGVGVCVRNEQGMPIVGMSVVIPTDRFNSRRILEYAAALRQAVADAETALKRHCPRGGLVF